MKFYKKSGFSLMEVVMSTAILSIAFGGMLMSVTRSKYFAENSVVSFVATHYANSLLETIQTFPYEDPSYPKPTIDPDTPSNCSTVFSLHDTDFSGGFDSTNSGIHDDSAPTTILTNLTESQIGIRFNKSFLPASPTPLNPISLSSTLQSNKWLTGFEDDDIGPNTILPSASNAGMFKISESESQKNIFGVSQGIVNNLSLAKYYYADDVDDFDGYRETRQVVPGINVTYSVSVMNIYGKNTDYLVEYNDSSGSLVSKVITQAPYSVMQPISLDNFPSGLTFTDAADPTEEQMRFAIAYYNQTLFKKITVVASWEYPPGSGIIKSIVIDGGKTNPRGEA